MTKTPELSGPLSRDGFHDGVNDRGETVLCLVSEGKIIWQEVHDAAKIERSVCYFLDLAKRSYQRTQSAPDAPHHTQSLPTLPVVKVGLSTDKTPGRENLMLQVGHVRVGFNISHEMLAQLGGKFMAASASTEKPN